MTLPTASPEPGFTEAPSAKRMSWRRCERPAHLSEGKETAEVILRSIGWIRDSFVAMGLVLELLAAEKRPLSGIIDELPRYAMIKEKLDLSAIGGRPVIEPALEKLRVAFANERVDDSDGVRIDFNEGWVHVRASNTEPIMRVIAEAETVEEARTLIQRASQAAGIS